jgi:hypothetical protein
MDFYIENISAVYFWLVLLVAFRNIPIGSKVFARALIFSFILMFVISVINSTGQMFYARKIASEGTVVATYQGFARSALVTAVILMCIIRSGWLPTLFFFAGVLLFLLGARSEFVGFIIVALIIIYFRIGWLKAVALWGPLLFAVVAYIVTKTNVLNGSSRILQLFDIGQASSYQSREGFEAAAILTIKDSPIFGSYASHLVYGQGTYAHDALSAWVSFGFIGFSLFVWLLFLSLIKSLRIALHSPRVRDPLVCLAIALSVYSALMAAVAKPIYYPVYAAAWGATIAIGLNMERVRKPHGSGIDATSFDGQLASN